MVLRFGVNAQCSYSSRDFEDHVEYLCIVSDVDSGAHRVAKISVQQRVHVNAAIVGRLHGAIRLFRLQCLDAFARHSGRPELESLAVVRNYVLGQLGSPLPLTTGEQEQHTGPVEQRSVCEIVRRFVLSRGSGRGVALERYDLVHAAAREKTG